MKAWRGMVLIWITILGISILSSPVKASSFIMNVVPDSISLCQCSSITPENIKVSIKNMYEYPDTYTFSLDAPEGWRYQIQMNAALDPGEERELDLFLINIDCCVVPGIYKAKLTAVSGMTGESVSKEIEIEVLNCYDVDLEVQQKYQMICSEKREPVSYSLKVKNNGKFKETFELSADKEWAVFSPSSVTLESGESTTVDMVVNPPQNFTGTDTITIYVKSTYSYAQDSETVMIEIKPCYNFSVQLQPQEQSICLGESAGYTLVIGNMGMKPDTYKIFGPNWVLIEANQVSLGGNSVGETGIVISPEEEGKKEFNLTVISSVIPELSKTVTGKVIVEDCSGVDISAEPVEIKVCKEIPETVEFKVNIKNTGKLEDTFKLLTTKGVLEKTKVFLKPGESEELTLSVDTEGINQTETITLTVSDRKISKNFSVKLVPEPCVSNELQIKPVNQSVCLCSTAKYEVIVKNTGKLNDSYVLEFESRFLNQTTPEFTLGPKESKSFTFGFSIPMKIFPGNYPIRVKIRSNYTEREESANLYVKEKSECYGVDIQVPEKVEGISLMEGKRYLQECEAVTVPITLKNSGINNDTYTVSVDGPEWVYIVPESITLAPEEEKELYLYISPPFDSEGDYTVKLEVKSFYTENSIEIPFTVVENVTRAEREVVNQTQEQVFLNITPITENITENITGLLIGEKKSEWKILAVIIITLIIIIILLARFILLVKR